MILFSSISQLNADTIPPDLLPQSFVSSLSHSVKVHVLKIGSLKHIKANRWWHKAFYVFQSDRRTVSSPNWYCSSMFWRWQKDDQCELMAASISDGPWRTCCFSALGHLQCNQRAYIQPPRPGQVHHKIGILWIWMSQAISSAWVVNPKAMAHSWRASWLMRRFCRSIPSPVAWVPGVAFLQREIGLDQLQFEGGVRKYHKRTGQNMDKFDTLRDTIHQNHPESQRHSGRSCGAHERKGIFPTGFRSAMGITVPVHVFYMLTPNLQ